LNIDGSSTTVQMGIDYLAKTRSSPDILQRYLNNFPKIGEGTGLIPKDAKTTLFNQLDEEYRRQIKLSMVQVADISTYTGQLYSNNDYNSMRLFAYDIYTKNGEYVVDTVPITFRKNTQNEFESVIGTSRISPQGSTIPNTNVDSLFVYPKSSRLINNVNIEFKEINIAVDDYSVKFARLDSSSAEIQQAGYDTVHQSLLDEGYFVIDEAGLRVDPPISIKDQLEQVLDTWKKENPDDQYAIKIVEGGNTQWVSLQEASDNEVLLSRNVILGRLYRILGDGTTDTEQTTSSFLFANTRFDGPDEKDLRRPIRMVYGLFQEHEGRFLPTTRTLFFDFRMKAVTGKSEVGTSSNTGAVYQGTSSKYGILIKLRDKLNRELTTSKRDLRSLADLDQFTTTFDETEGVVSLLLSRLKSYKQGIIDGLIVGRSGTPGVLAEGSVVKIGDSYKFYLVPRELVGTPSNPGKLFGVLGEDIVDMIRTGKSINGVTTDDLLLVHENKLVENIYGGNYWPIAEKMEKLSYIAKSVKSRVENFQMINTLLEELAAGNYDKEIRDQLGELFSTSKIPNRLDLISHMMYRWEKGILDRIKVSLSGNNENEFENNENQLISFEVEYHKDQIGLQQLYNLQIYPNYNLHPP